MPTTRKEDKDYNRVLARQFRLEERTLDQLDLIAEHYGLPSRTAAIRYAARELAAKIAKKS